MSSESKNLPTAARARTPMRPLLAALAVLFLVVAVGIAGFAFIEKRPLGDAIYLTFVTISTLGMLADDSAPVSEFGKFWIVFLIIVGIGAAVCARIVVASMIVEGKVRRILGRRQVTRKIASLSDHIIVCGYGRTGKFVCQDLQQRGLAPIVIDIDDACTTLAEEAGLLYILGDANQESMLLDAGIKRARGVVAALANDADNVLVTLMARDLNPKLFIAATASKVDSEQHLRRAGADTVICPQLIGAKRLANILTRPGVVDFLDFASEGLDLEAEQYHLTDGNALIGQSLREANLPNQAGILVVALKRADGNTFFNPSAETVLQTDDVMLITGRPGSMAVLEKMYS